MMCAAVAADDAGSSAPAAESKPRLVMLPAEPIPLPPIEGVATDNQLTLVEVEQLALAYHPAVREAAGPLLRDVRVVDRYDRPPVVPADHVSLTLGLTFQDPARTLTGEEVQAAMDHVVSALRRRGWEIRGE